MKGSHLSFANQDSSSSTSEVIMCRWVDFLTQNLKSDIASGLSNQTKCDKM